MRKCVDGKMVEMSAEEIKQRQAEEKRTLAAKRQRKEELQAYVEAAEALVKACNLEEKHAEKALAAFKYIFEQHARALANDGQKP